MKKFVALAMAGLVAGGSAFAVEPNDAWKVVKNSPFFSLSAEFFFKKGEWDHGKTVRTGRFCPRYYYDLYDTNGKFEARGITRAVSLGLLYAWGIDVDVYQQEEWIGAIEGKTFTSARAKYVFYDAGGRETGIAYLNSESAEFVIVSPGDETQVIAELKGKAFGDVSTWEMKVLRPNSIHEKLLKVFTAFVADYSNHFLAPPKIRVYYYHTTGNKP